VAERRFCPDLCKLKMFYLYILKSEKFSSYYTGITGDLKNRLTKHNLGRVKSTKSKRPWLLVHTEEFATLSGARKRELFFKSQKKRATIETAIKHF